MVPCIATYISQMSTRQGGTGPWRARRHFAVRDVHDERRKREGQPGDEDVELPDPRRALMSRTSVATTSTTNQTKDTSCSAAPTVASSRHREGIGPGGSIGPSVHHSRSQSSTSAP